MMVSVSSAVEMLLRLGGVALILNEVRGLILAAPVMWGLYQSGGSVMAIWLAICSLGGIALSVIVPTCAARFAKGKLTAAAS